MDFTIGKKIDPILESYFKGQIDLISVRSELIILFNNELEQKLFKHGVMQAEGLDKEKGKQLLIELMKEDEKYDMYNVSAEGATVGQRSVGTNAAGAECAYCNGTGYKQKTPYGTTVSKCEKCEAPSEGHL